MELRAHIITASKHVSSSQSPESPCSSSRLLTDVSVQCAFGEGVTRSITYSVTQMGLDILGDLLSE